MSSNRTLINKNRATTIGCRITYIDGNEIYKKGCKKGCKKDKVFSLQGIKNLCNLIIRIISSKKEKVPELKKEHT